MKSEEVKKLNSVMIASKKKKALEISIKQGSANGAVASLGDSTITPFALALKASSFDIGVLNAVVGLLGPLAQLWGSKKEYAASRKSVIRKLEMAQIILWLPLAAIAIYAFHFESSRILAYLTILLYLIIFILSSAEYPSWFSWMGDLVKKDERGRYFGRRNTILGIVSLTVIIAGSIVLDNSKAGGYLMLAFAALFICASLTRIISRYYLHRQYEPKNTQKEAKKEYFIKFIREKNNLTKFAWALAIFNFAIMIASPFFAVYMLTKLSFSYFVYTLVIMSNTGFYLLFTPMVGKFADKYGSAPLLKISCWLFAITPPLWLLSSNPILLIFVPQLISGLANATLTSATTNFSYEAISTEKRGQYISYINVLVGVGVLVGSLIGGALLSWLPQSTNIFSTVFIISAIARAIVAIFVSSGIKSVKKTVKIPKVSLNLLHPLKTLHTDTHFIKQIIND